MINLGYLLLSIDSCKLDKLNKQDALDNRNQDVGMV